MRRPGGVQWGDNQMIWTFIEDLRHAARGLHRDPFLTIAAGITLAICIGANTTVFSVANSILIRPLPYPGSERIDWITERSGPGHQDVGAAPDYYRIRDWNGVFKDVAAFNGMTLNWTGTDRPEQLDAATVSASFFRVMGTPPMMGRFLAPQEEGGKAPAVAVISYAFWRNHWGGNAEVLGKTIGLNRKPYTIIGVMPQGFDFPRGSQLWIPLDLDESSARIISPALPIRVVSMVARRKADVNPRQLASEMSRLSFVIRAEYPQEFRQRGFRNDLVIGAVPLQEQLTGQLRPAVLVLTGAVSLVLLIACVNVANLLLARAGGRQRELAIRLALGSSRARTIRQMLAESLVLALPGGIAGIGIAAAAVRLLDATKPAMLVNYPAISMDFRVMAFTVALTLATSILFGIVPALSAAGTDVQAVLKAASATHTAGRRATRLRQLLVVAELAVSLVLLIGASLLARSFLNLAHTELGFRSDQLLTFRVNPIGPFDRVYGPFYAAVLERLQQIPFVRSAALLGDIPLSDEDFYGSGRIRVIGRPAAPFRERPIVNNTMVSADFFRTLEIPLKRGRVFDAHDSVASAETVSFGFVHAEPVVVNEALVRRIFPGEDPIGKQLGFGPDERNITWTIIGTVGDVRGGALGAGDGLSVYLRRKPGVPRSIRSSHVRRPESRHSRRRRAGAEGGSRPAYFRCEDHGSAQGRCARAGTFSVAAHRHIRRDCHTPGCRRSLRHHVLRSVAPYTRNRHSDGDGRTARGCDAFDPYPGSGTRRSSGSDWPRGRRRGHTLPPVHVVRRHAAGFGDLRPYSRRARRHRDDRIGGSSTPRAPDRPDHGSSGRMTACHARLAADGTVCENAGRCDPVCGFLSLPYSWFCPGSKLNQSSSMLNVRSGC